MYNELIADLKEISNWIVATASTASFSHDELNALHYADKVRDGADLIEQQQALTNGCKRKFRRGSASRRGCRKNQDNT